MSQMNGAVPGNYLADIRAQGPALRKLAKELGTPAAFAPLVARWRDLGRPTIVLTGMGASLYAADAVSALNTAHGPEVRVASTAQLLERQHQFEDALVVAVSQSGESVEIKELLESVPADRIAAITNAQAGALARTVPMSVVLQMPPDRSVAVKTYTGTVAALALMLGALAGGDMQHTADELLEAANEVEGALGQWDSDTQEAAKRFDGARAVAVLAWGAAVATAREAALIFKEGARTPSEGMHADEFRHGSVEVVDDRFGVVVFATSNVVPSARAAAIAELRRLTPRVIVIGGPADEVPDDVPHVSTQPLSVLASLITDIVPIQLLAFHLAKQSGYAAGEFRNTTPVISERPSGRLVSAGRP